MCKLLIVRAYLQFIISLYKLIQCLKFMLKYLKTINIEKKNYFQHLIYENLFAFKTQSLLVQMI